MLLSRRIRFQGSPAANVMATPSRRTVESEDPAGPTAELCRFVARLALPDVPPRVVEFAKGLLIDWLGSAYAGKGASQVERIEAFAREHGFAERLHILLERSDIPNLLAAADVFCMPSLWEGLPLAVLEAMFAGKPIIASGVSGIPEAITSGTHGLLTPPGDIGALADALRSVLGSAELRARLGAAARARAKAEFAIGVMADRYERLYFERAAAG